MPLGEESGASVTIATGSLLLIPCQLSPLLPSDLLPRLSSVVGPLIKPTWLLERRMRVGVEALTGFHAQIPFGDQVL